MFGQTQTIKLLNPFLLIVGCRANVNFAGRHFDIVESTGKAFFDFSEVRVGQNHDFIAVNPIGGRCHDLQAVSQLQRVDTAKNLVDVSPTRSWIVHRKANPFVRADDEQSANRFCRFWVDFLIRVQHSKLHCQLARLVSDDRIRKVAANVFTIVVNIVNPLQMRGQWVHRMRQNFHISLLKFVLMHSDASQFGGTDGREVGGVGEQKAPTANFISASESSKNIFFSTHESPSQSWNKIGPLVVSASKFGTTWFSFILLTWMSFNNWRAQLKVQSLNLAVDSVL